MEPPNYAFTPVFRSGKWCVTSPKAEIRPLEEAIAKKIRHIVSQFQATDKPHSVKFTGNTLTINLESGGVCTTQIDPKALILTILKQVGPNCIKQGMTKYKELFPLVDRLEIGQVKKADILEIYQELETVFREIEHEQTQFAWAQKADLMDAIDLLVDKFQKKFKEIEPIEVRPHDFQSRSAPSGGVVPLLPYHQLKALSSKEFSGVDYQDVSGMKEALNDSLVFENTGMAGRAIQFLTKQRRVGSTAYAFGLIYRILTRLIGWSYSRPSRLRLPLMSIVKAAQNMGIRPIEVLAKQVSNQDGTQFYYRGPRYLFGRSIHEFTSVDDFFRRDLTAPARQEYLAKAQDVEKSLMRDYGIPLKEGTSRIAISNSDCRVRVRKLTDFSRPQEIVGKVLTKEGAEEAIGEDPTYYLGTYAFTTKQLLGLELTDNLESHTLSEKSTLGDAQRELLAGMARLFQEEGSVQVIQRLAPADIHNYTAPVNGIPLSLVGAAEALRKRAEVMKDEREKNLLNQLSIHLQKDLVQKNRTTIDIYGGLIGNESVQTGAITNKPSILAQNDRKIMLFEHDDGSLSLHVFIGATGVNRVSVNQESIHMDQGEQQGDMGFGEEPSTGKLRQGARQGGFEKEGSTVISYYFPSDFTPLDTVKKAQESLAYQQTVQRKNKKNQLEQMTLRKEVEILCQMGDPLLLKTEIVMAQELEKVVGKDFTTCKSAEAVFKIGLKKITPEKNALLYKILTSDEKALTWSERQLKERLQHTVKERLQILRTKAELDSLIEDDLDVAKQLFG